MAYFGKLFKSDKAENYDAFVDSLGLPEDRAAQMKKVQVSYKLVKNGDTYTFTTDYGVRTREITFKAGVEFDEAIREDLVAKTVVTVAGDTFTHVQKFPGDRIMTIKREFSDSNVKETLTSNSWSGTAYRYYKA